MMLLRNLVVGVLLVSASLPAQALRQDVLIVVNDNSVDSPGVGAYYAQQRGIDPANIVHVRIPDSYFISWDEFRQLRDQLIYFMQNNTLADPALTPVVCTEGDPPFYCPASMDQLRAHTKIRYVVTTRGVPTRMVVDGSTLFEPASPSSVDNYLKYWLINYFAVDTPLKFTGREVAFGDGRGMREVQPSQDRELIVGRIDGLTLDSAKALVDRALAAESAGLYGKLFGSTEFFRWRDGSTGQAIYPDWRYQLGMFGEARAECVDYLDQPGNLPEGKSPSHCLVQLNEDSNPVGSRLYPAPGNAGSRQPKAVDVLIYQGSLDGQAAVSSFNSLLNWRRDDQCTITLCSDAADPAACRATSTDVYREINTGCVGVEPGFLGYNHQSYPISYLTGWPTGWYKAANRSNWFEGGQGEGDVDRLAFPEVRDDTGFDDTYSLWFRNTDQVADPKCFSGRDFSVMPDLSCVDQRRVILTQKIEFGARDLNAGNPQTYQIRFRYKANNISAPTVLRVSFFVHDTGGRQTDYGFSEVATLASGNTGWTLAETRFQLDPALHSAASYDGIKVTMETTGVFAGELGIDAVSVQEVSDGLELAENGSFADGHRRVATGDHAATFLDRLGGTAFWGSVGHHQSGGCAFCFNGLETLVYFMRGLPLGDAVWFNASNNSGVLYGDPLYSPVAVRLNPVNATDTVSGVVDLYGSTVNGRDPGVVSTGYTLSVCPGSDFFVCDQAGSWQPTGVSGAGGSENALLGQWDTGGLAPGPYTLRLAVTSQNTVTGRSQTFNDFYPLTVEATPGVLQFEQSSYRVAEDGGSALVDVVRTGGSFGTITVDYSTVNGSAIAGEDYTAVSGTLTFADNVTRQSFSIPIIDDSIYEGDEGLSVVLSGISGNATIGNLATADVKIMENESPPAHVPVLNSNGVNGLVLIEGRSLSVRFSATDQDPGDSLTFSVSPSTLGTATFTGDVLTFAALRAGKEVLTVTVTDSTGLSDSISLPVVVNPAGSHDSNDDGLSDDQAEHNGLDSDDIDGDSDDDEVPDSLEIGDPDDAADSDHDDVIDALEKGEAARDSAELRLLMTPPTAQTLGLDQYRNAEVVVSVPAGAIRAVRNPATGFPFFFIESDFPTIDGDYDYPEGLFSFSVDLPGGQSSVSVTIQLPPGQALPDDAVVRKLDINGNWQTLTTAIIDRVQRTLTVTLEDNDGVFDSDPAVGTIGDPLGIALPASTPQPAASGGSGGGGGGCVLRHLEFGTGDFDPLWLLLLCASLSRLCGHVRLRR